MPFQSFCGFFHGNASPPLSTSVEGASEDDEAEEDEDAAEEMSEADEADTLE